MLVVRYYNGYSSQTYANLASAVLMAIQDVLLDENITSCVLLDIESLPRLYQQYGL